MTKSTITREQAQKIIVAADEVITALAGTNEDVHPDDSKKMCELWDDLNDRYAPPVVVRELARMALAAMDSEPVAWTDEEELRDLRKSGFCEMFSVEPISKDADMYRVIPLYRHAQQAPERDNVRREHAEWSQATFGNVGPVGPLKHLSKEALEAAEQPGDLSEWADMQFLLWDAQRRAGITDEQITQAMIEKLAVNKQREWPEPKDGEPRLHIKAQPAPVVLDERESFESFMAERFGDLVDHRRAKNGDQGYMAWDMVVAWIVWQARAAMLQAEPVTANKLGNSPVIPDGYVMVPKEPTAEMQSAGASAIRIETTAINKLWTGNAVFRAMLAAAPQEVK